MTIFVNYSSLLDRPDDPMVVDRGKLFFHPTACYEAWWSSPWLSSFGNRSSPGQVRVLVKSHDTEGELNTIHNVVQWIRDRRLDVRLIKVLHETRMVKTINKEINGGVIVSMQYVGESIEAKAIELQYTQHDPADKIFFGLCLMRFLSSEFSRSIPENASCRQFFSNLFMSPPMSLGHMPVKDYTNISGNPFNRADLDLLPKYCTREFGKGKYAFWMSLDDRAWGPKKITDHDAPLTCGIYAQEWLQFYREWIQTEDAGLDY